LKKFDCSEIADDRREILALRLVAGSNRGKGTEALGLDEGMDLRLHVKEFCEGLNVLVACSVKPSIPIENSNQFLLQK
jgi:hypothetical protein